jgi:hypothetical protein
MPKNVALEETYEGVEKLIYHTVNRWIRRHGGDFDELRSVANEAFMRAYHGFKIGNARWSTYLVSVVWNALIDEAHDQTKRRQRFVNCSDICYDSSEADVSMDHVATARSSRFDFRDVTEDAKFVIGLVLDAPVELYYLVPPSRHRNTDRLDVRWWNAIKEHLEDNLGWAPERIAQTAKEISAAL